ncbi:MAG: LacI family transcriptional regulator [Bacteroidetes bacterium]|nr:LacI family transcriptional regulator [Bacteroidota bacterium]
MKITIKDVAKKAGVSTATVSLVITNNSRISQDTRKKVLKAIKDLDYTPSRSARGLVSKKTGNLGFILTDDHFLRTEPFYTRIFLGTEFAAHVHDFYILLTTLPNTFSIDDPLPRFVREKNVDGIIIAGKVPTTLIQKLEKYKIPLVFIDYVPPMGEFPIVLMDNISGGETATKHLIDLGHKNIAFLGGDVQHPSIADRLVGYKRMLEKHNITVSSKLISTGSPEPIKEEGYKAMKSLLSKNNNISAVFACNDAMALGAMQYLKDIGIDVPGKISIVGFDDIESNIFLNPPLTTIRVPKIDLGVEAVKLLSERITNKNIARKKVLVPVELIIRESTRKIS